jgi:hypothetical protein
VRPAHTLVFLSTDGGATGGLGAVRFAKRLPYPVDAVVNLSALAGHGAPRLVFSGDAPRTAAPLLITTASSRIAEQTGQAVRRPTVLAQLIDLAFPFTLGEQGPFDARGVPAVTITTGGERPAEAFTDRPKSLDLTHLTALGRAAQELVGSLDQGLELMSGTPSFVWAGGRAVRGWAIELLLISLFVPYAVAVIDLFATTRRRRIPIAPALRSLRSRIAFWLFAGLVLGTALAVVWLACRPRLVPRRPAEPSEQLAGNVVALLGAGVVALLVVATNPFALLFCLPALHAWLWLPQVRSRRPVVRALVFALGLIGPLLLLLSLAVRFGLGFDAPWYVLELVALRYVSPFAVVIALLGTACAAQLAMVAAGRYAPYPRAGERPARGPVRELVRRFAQANRARRQPAR